MINLIWNYVKTNGYPTDKSKKYLYVYKGAMGGRGIDCIDTYEAKGNNDDQDRGMIDDGWYYYAWADFSNLADYQLQELFKYPNKRCVDESVLMNIPEPSKREAKIAKTGTWRLFGNNENNPR